MNISLIYFTQAGGETCQRIAAALKADGHCCRCSEGRGLEGGLSRWTEEAFAAAEALVFVSATGIAVRAVAPYLRSKVTDPAVVVADEKGAYAISLLSGHLGGANQLTRRIAAAIGAEPVITTATDINGRFAVDEWAKRQGLFISDIKAAKEVSAALLRREAVGFYSEFPVRGKLPEGLYFLHGIDGNARDSEPGQAEPGQAGVGIAISFRRPADLPFQRCLWLCPKALIVGVGCRRGAPEAQIRTGVEAALEENGLRTEAIGRIASIDIKKGEPGLIAYGKRLGVPFQVFSAQELAREELPEGFAASDFVKSVTGVDNVCERAAIRGSQNADSNSNSDRGRGQSRLLVRKTVRQGVTVAVAANVAELYLTF